MLRNDALYVWLAGQRHDSRDLPLYGWVFCEIVKLQDLLQGGQAAVDERQVVRCQMGNQPPLQAAPHRRSNRFGRRHDAARPNQRARFQGDLTEFAGEWQLPSQIPISARYMNRQGLHRWQGRLEPHVYQRQVYFRAPITLSFRELATGVPVG